LLIWLGALIMFVGGGPVAVGPTAARRRPAPGPGQHRHPARSLDGCIGQHDSLHVSIPIGRTRKSNANTARLNVPIVVVAPSSLHKLTRNRRD
jgi:hypothetical protein